MGRGLGKHNRDANARFDEKVNRLPGDGCWLWTGATSNGYGRFKVRSYKHIQATRFSYEREYGPIADELFLCHKCDNRPCVRPDHLFPGTQQENVDDMMRKGRWAPYERKRKAHCLRGHAMTPENTKVVEIGGYEFHKCVTCLTLREKARTERRRIQRAIERDQR